MRPSKIFSHGRPLFLLTLLALLTFNVLSFRDRLKVQESFGHQTLRSDLYALEAQYWETEELRRGKSLEDKLAEVPDELLTEAFPLEFIALRQDQPNSSETKLRIFVPQQGKHRIRIEIWSQKENICDQFFDAEAGQRSGIQFSVNDNWIETKLGEQEPIRSKLEKPMRSPRIFAPQTPPLFIGPNQESSRYAVTSFAAPRTGVLSQFRFVPQMSLDHELTVRVSAESEGLTSTAADDWLTMWRLIDMAEGHRAAVPYRYEKGHYFFDEVPDSAEAAAEN